jgi:hypothetical protein
MNTRMKAGTMVQNNSKGWDSLIFLSMLIFVIIEYILNPTIETIKIKMVMAWSWKNVSCSIKGLDESWKLRALHEGIIKEIIIYN